MSELRVSEMRRDTLRALKQKIEAELAERERVAAAIAWTPEEVTQVVELGMKLGGPDAFEAARELAEMIKAKGGQPGANPFALSDGAAERSAMTDGGPAKTAAADAADGAAVAFGSALNSGEHVPDDDLAALLFELRLAIDWANTTPADHPDKSNLDRSARMAEQIQRQVAGGLINLDTARTLAAKYGLLAASPVGIIGAPVVERGSPAERFERSEKQRALEAERMARETGPERARFLGEHGAVIADWGNEAPDIRRLA